ncbi:MAG: hypothetical protein EBT86_07615 [Actinobacteria bacterium]|nr:hypothetical protein [Actinomycetota bacterium]
MFDTKIWLAHVENRIEDMDYYLNQTINYCEANNIINNETVFTLSFLTILWVSYMREEPISRREIFEILCIKDWEDLPDSEVELGSKLEKFDLKDLLDAVSKQLPTL